MVCIKFNLTLGTAENINTALTTCMFVYMQCRRGTRKRATFVLFILMFLII